MPNLYFPSQAINLSFRLLLKIDREAELSIVHTILSFLASLSFYPGFVFIPVAIYFLAFLLSV